MFLFTKSSWFFWGKHLNPVIHSWKPFSRTVSTPNLNLGPAHVWKGSPLLRAYADTWDCEVRSEACPTREQNSETWSSQEWDRPNLGREGNTLVSFSLQLSQIHTRHPYPRTGCLPQRPPQAEAGLYHTALPTACEGRHRHCLNLIQITPDKKVVFCAKRRKTR